MSSLAATYEKMTGLRTTHDWMGEMIEVQLKRINDTV